MIRSTQRATALLALAALLAFPPGNAGAASQNKVLDTVFHSDGVRSFIEVPNAVPGDATLNASQVSLYVDETTNELKAKVKESDGTVSAFPVADFSGAIDDLLLPAATTLTLSGDAATVTQSHHAIDTEASAASDDLVTLNGGVDGMVVFLRAANTARTVVIKTSGNIVTPGGKDISLFEATDGVWAVYVSGQTKWFVLAAELLDGGIGHHSSLDLDGNLDHDSALTAAGDGVNSATTINHATASAEGLDVSAAQLTTGRSSGTVDAIKAATTSLAGDTGGTYNGVEITATDGGGVVTHNAIKVGAGHDAVLDLTAPSSGESDIALRDNVADALTVREAANAYITLVSTDTAESVDVAKNLNASAGVDVSGAALTVANQAITQTTGGQVTFAGNVDANAGLDVAGGALTIANQAITQSTGGQVTFAGNVDANAGLDVAGASLTVASGQVLTTNTVNETSAANGVVVDGLKVKDGGIEYQAGNARVMDLSAAATGEADIVLPDNKAEALVLRESTNAYISLVSTDTAESVDVAKNLNASAGVDVSGAALTVANQAITQTTGGQVTFAGNVDANAGLDVAGGALTIANQAITQSTGGQVTFAGNVDANSGLDVAGASLTVASGQVLTTNTVNETSAANGVVVDGLKVKDGGIEYQAGNARVMDLSAAATGEADIVLPDNKAEALVLRESTNAYISLVSTDLAESVDVAKNLNASAGVDVSGGALTVANQAITQTTGGQVTFAGNVDANAGLDVAGGPLTIAAQAITQTTSGQVTFAGNVDANSGLDVAGAALTVAAGQVARTDTVNETTAANGVVVDGLKVKDGGIEYQAGNARVLDVSAAATGEADVVVADAQAAALTIREGANDYLRIKTSNGDEAVQFLQRLDLDSNLDASSQATTFGIIDNSATALSFSETANSYLVFVSSDGSEAVASSKRLTTTDGVASGPVRVVGGGVSVATAAGSALTGSASETVLATYTIPANSLKAGTVLRVRGKARVTADAGATTLTCRLRLGTTTLTGTALITSSAVDTSSGHLFPFEFELVSRAAPSGTSAIVGTGSFMQPGANGGAYISGNLDSTNFATNGALLLELTGQWSAGDANSVQSEMFTVELAG